MIRNILKRCFYLIYYPSSFVWRKLDRTGSWKETQWWIDHLPSAMFTPATYASYAGWLHNQGMFSALVSIYLQKEKPKIMDFGCGMGSLAAVCSFFVKDGGSFLGVDTDAKSIEACNKTYSDLKNCSFYLTKDRNAWYEQKDNRGTSDGIDWPVENGSLDLLLAMSVFTHLQEKDAIAYMEKIYSVLAKDGLAILSFHILRNYVNSNSTYNFIHPLTPGWATSNSKVPEHAIGLTQDALHKLIEGKFKILTHIEGGVTGGRHPSLQDLFVFKKI